MVFFFHPKNWMHIDGVCIWFLSTDSAFAVVFVVTFITDARTRMRAHRRGIDLYMLGEGGGSKAFSLLMRFPRIPLFFSPYFP